jgi:glycosyltransferase involved in cell wall biosynthesis
MTASVTWLLPVKDGMPFLSETLASIAAQTSGDYQVLAWDNGSTDSSVTELKRWIPERLPGKIVTDRPLGLGDCLAQMVFETNTEFCARIDADDVNVPTRLERQLVFLREHSHIAAVGSQVTRIDESGREFGQYYSLPLKNDDILHRMLHAWVMWHPTVLFRRKSVLAAGNYRNWQPLIEDYDLWMRLAVCHKLANMDACLVKYRVREDGATALASKNGTLEDAMRRCFVMNAPTLFGCSPEEASLLRSGGHRFLLPTLLRIARHLCSTQGGTLRERLSSDSWIEAIRQLIGRRDVASRLCLLGPRAIQRRISRGYAHGAKFARSSLLKSVSR